MYLRTCVFVYLCICRKEPLGGQEPEDDDQLQEVLAEVREAAGGAGPRGDATHGQVDSAQCALHCTTLRTAHCTALHCIPPSHYPQFNCTDASPRTAEIAAYFTHFNLQPVHQVRWTGVGPCDYINPCSRFHLTAGAAPVELGTKLEDVPADLRASMSCKGPNIIPQCHICIYAQLSLLTVVDLSKNAHCTRWARIFPPHARFTFEYRNVQRPPGGRLATIRRRRLAADGRVCPYCLAAAEVA